MTVSRRDEESSLLALFQPATPALVRSQQMTISSSPACDSYLLNCHGDHVSKSQSFGLLLADDPEPAHEDDVSPEDSTFLKHLNAEVIMPQSSTASSSGETTPFQVVGTPSTIQAVLDRKLAAEYLNQMTFGDHSHNYRVVAKKSKAVNVAAGEYVGLLVDNLVQRAVMSSEFSKSGKSTSDDVVDELLNVLKSERDTFAKLQSKLDRKDSIISGLQTEILQRDRQLESQRCRFFELENSHQRSLEVIHKLQNDLMKRNDEEEMIIEARLKAEADLDKFQQDHRKLKQQNRKLADAYEHLRSRSTEKIAVLKRNCEKAEAEVDDLSATLTGLVNFLRNDDSPETISRAKLLAVLTQDE